MPTTTLIASTASSSTRIDSSTTFITNGNQIYIKPFNVLVNNINGGTRTAIANFTLPSNLKNIIAGSGSGSGESFISLVGSGNYSLDTYTCDVNTSTGQVTVFINSGSSYSGTYSITAHVPILFFQQ